MLSRATKISRECATDNIMKDTLHIPDKHVVQWPNTALNESRTRNIEGRTKQPKFHDCMDSAIDKGIDINVLGFQCVDQVHHQQKQCSNGIPLAHLSLTSLLARHITVSEPVHFENGAIPSGYGKGAPPPMKPPTNPSSPYTETRITDSNSHVVAAGFPDPSSYGGKIAINTNSNYYPPPPPGQQQNLPPTYQQLAYQQSSHQIPQPNYNFTTPGYTTAFDQIKLNPSTINYPNLFIPVSKLLQ
ncbi:4799_t:CDS:2 [Entrophospora sp. SA101]|nr:4799_t:CDS:2 [Entrophospora sp. SA101]